MVSNFIITYLTLKKNSTPLTGFSERFVTKYVFSGNTPALVINFLRRIWDNIFAPLLVNLFFKLSVIEAENKSCKMSLRQNKMCVSF